MSFINDIESLPEINNIEWLKSIPNIIKSYDAYFWNCYYNNINMFALTNEHNNEIVFGIKISGNIVFSRKLLTDIEQLKYIYKISTISSNYFDIIEVLKKYPEI